VNVFQNSKWKQEHVTELKNRFKILENIEDILTIILMKNGKTLKP
jgi:hypothetical protein